MLKFGNKEFRNLQEQVKKNMDDILFILQEEGVLNEFGIKVVGQESTIADMPTVADYKEDNPDWSYGDAYAIGTEEPYELYILTRANGTHPNDYWFNIGTFPAPGPQGPKGEQGDVGPQGPTGNPGANGISPQLGVGNVVVETLESDQDATVAITESGTLANPIWNFNFGIPKGQDGSSLTSVTWGSIYGSIADQTDLIDLVQGRVKKVTTTGSRRVYGVDDSGNQAVYTLGSDIVTPVNLSGYAQTSVANIYTEEQHMTKGIAFEASSVDFIKNDGENFYDYVLPYASGTIALSESFGGSYSGSYWTSLKINGTTKQIPQGGGTGGNAEWGSITGTLSNQTDLISKFSEYATISSVNQQFEDFESATSQFVLGISEEDRRYAADVASIALSSANSYTDTSISGLSSIYAQISDIPTKTSELVNDSGFITSTALSEYATTSALNSAVSSINSTISSLDYASVGALSSGTVIPSYTAGSNITLSNNRINTVSDPTFENIIVDNGTAGLYTNSLGDTGLTYHMNDEDADIRIIQGVPELNNTNDNYMANLRVGTQGIQIQKKDINEDVTTTYDLFDVASQVSANTSNIQTLSSNISSLDYASVGALSSATVIPSVYGTNDGTNWTSLTINNDTYDIPSVSEYATVSALNSAVSDINSTISGLSSVYAPLSDYASQAWVSANFLSIGAIPSISGYAELSGSNTFTGVNRFSNVTYFDNNVQFNASNNFNSVNYFWSSVYHYVENYMYSGAALNFVDANLNPTGSIFASDNTLIIKGTPSIKLSTTGYTSIYADIIDLSCSYAYYNGNEIATVNQIPSTSNFASISYVDSQISGLSSVYAPIGYLPSGVSGYASEIWTFTLSDNTTVSKTILVG